MFSHTRTMLFFLPFFLLYLLKNTPEVPLKVKGCPSLGSRQGASGLKARSAGPLGISQLTEHPCKQRGCLSCSQSHSHSLHSPLEEGADGGPWHLTCALMRRKAVCSTAWKQHHAKTIQRPWDALREVSSSMQAPVLHGYGSTVTLLLVTRTPYHPFQNSVSWPPCSKRTKRTPGP